jgi:O-antigen ligase
MLFVCLAAMFMTGSRAGTVLSLAMLVFAVSLFFWRSLPRRTGILAVFGVGAGLGLILLQVMGAGVSARFGRQGLADEGRFEAYRSTSKIIADHPWFGTGLGTFAQSFPAYRSSQVSMRGVWDLAHSTPLEMAAEVGIPLTVLVLIGWIAILATLVHGVSVRRRDVIVPVAALSVASLALLHSLIDFSLQMPGYSIIVFALVGAGLAQSFRSIVSSNGRYRTGNIRGRLPSRL